MELNWFTKWCLMVSEHLIWYNQGNRLSIFLNDIVGVGSPCGRGQDGQWSVQDRIRATRRDR